jgi:energy-coupling factor transport system substrate-specific component
VRGIMQKTITKQNTAQVLISKVTQKLDLRQNLRSLIILFALTSAAVAGRVALQNVPSVEPITPFAILAGFMLGSSYGFATGTSAFYLSNFMVWGGQGPWTIFQCLGAGLAGYTAGWFGKTWKNFKMYTVAIVAGILVYETVVILTLGTMWSGFFGLPLFILTSLPFVAVHLVSSIGIGSALWGVKKTLPKLGGKIIEKTKLVLGSTIDSNTGDSRMSPEHFQQEVWRKHGTHSKLVNRLRWSKRDNN